MHMHAYIIFWIYKNFWKPKSQIYKGLIIFRVLYLCVPLLGTESQNERIVGIERDLWWSFGPTSLLKQGYLEQVAWDNVERISEYLQGRKKKKAFKVFPDVHMAPPYFNLYPLPLVLLLSTTEKILSLSLYPFLTYLYVLERSPQAFSSPGLTRLFQPFLTE